MTRSGVAWLLASAVVAGSPVGADPQAPARAHTVYVTAVDGKGRPLTTLLPSEFAIKQAGSLSTLLKVELATAPLQVAILVDDNGTGVFRYGLSAFVQRLQGQAQIALSSVTVQSMKVIDYTGNFDLLSRAIARLGVRPGAPEGGQLLAGIYEAARELRTREAPRPVIVVLTVGGSEHSSLLAHDVLEELRRSGAALHVFSILASALRVQVDPTNAAGLLDERLNLSEVLGDGPRQSGGYREELLATAGLVSGLEQLAVQLVNQYAVTYMPPGKARAGDRISVSITRRGVSLRAPTRVPD